MTDYRDTLGKLNKHIPLKDKIIAVHASLRELFPFISRIAITIYDQETSLLKSYLHSSGNGDPYEHYQTKLDEAPSLKNILDKGLPRVINRQLTYEQGDHEHAVRMGRSGYAASYTIPMFNDGVFFGFIFFNSNEENVFDEKVLRQIDIYGHMIALMVIKEITAIRTLTAAVKITSRIIHARDPETGSHVDRMSRYSRIIARALADKYNLDDNYIEHVFMFAPLHDIGKIGIPDNILLKPGELNEDELLIMRSHVRKGREIIEDLFKNFGLENFEYIDVLRNIAECHHENINGTGYPAGIRGEQIPLEARIVAVADVFDALTSKRPYKEAWSNEKALETIQGLVGVKLDPDCVNALIDNMDEVVQIQQQFGENYYG